MKGKTVAKTEKPVGPTLKCPICGKEFSAQNSGPYWNHRRAHDRNSAREDGVEYKQIVARVSEDVRDAFRENCRRAGRTQLDVLGALVRGFNASCQKARDLAQKKAEEGTDEASESHTD